MMTRISGATRICEIDVAIFCGDQMHVIECKTGMPKDKPGAPNGKTSKSNDIQKELDHLARVKEAVVGPFGKAWLLRARALQPANAADADGFETPAKSYAMAKRLGLQIAAGAAEIEAVCKALSKLAGNGGRARALSDPAVSLFRIPHSWSGQDIVVSWLGEGKVQPREHNVESFVNFQVHIQATLWRSQILES